MKGFELLVPVDRHPWRWWHFLLLPVSIPILIAFSSVLGMVAVAFAAFFCIAALPELPAYFRRHLTYWKSERGFISRMRAVGRYVPWSEFESELAAGNGTLIVEEWWDGPDADFCRFWWTAEDVLGTAPVDPPSPDALDLFGTYAPHPFVVWCHEKFLDVERGNARSSEPDSQISKELHAGKIGDNLRRLFPRVRVVETVACRHFCRTCGYDLRASSDLCPECGAAIRQQPRCPVTPMTVAE